MKNSYSWRSYLPITLTRIALCLSASAVHGAMVADWTADGYVSGQNWTSNTGGIVATVNGSPELLDGIYNTHDAIDFNGNSYFVVPSASNPVAGLTQFTMVAVFKPLTDGPTGGMWYQANGLIGMEQNGSVPDWGFGWLGNRTVAGVGGPDVTLLSPREPNGQLTVAMFTWSGGVQKLYRNGVLVSTNTGVATAPRNAADFALAAITSGGANGFNGHIAELQIHNTDETAQAATIYNGLRDKYFSTVVLESEKLNPAGGTIVVKDTTTRQANPNGIFRVYFDGSLDPLPAAAVTATKVGDTTTIKFTVAADPNISYPYEISVPLIGGGENFFSPRTLLPFTLPGSASFAGPSGAVGSWGIREYTVAANPNLAGAITVAKEATAPFEEDLAAPVFNHFDPDTNNAGSIGNFNNDFDILTNTPTVDDNFVVVGRTKVTVPAAGDYTFSVHSDDGFAMRVSGGAGGRFISTGGSGGIDQGDDQVILLDAGTGDSNTRGVYHFDGAGTYDILYLGWDGGAGGYYEVAWAPGVFTEDRQTNTWSLVGTPTAPNIPAFRERWLANLPGPLGTNGAFGTRTYINAGDINGLGAANLFLTDTARTPENDGLTFDAQLPYLNHRDPINPNNNGGIIPGDLPFPGDTAADDNNVVTTAKARISIPTTGTYTFHYQGDDGFMLRFKGVNGAPDPSYKKATGTGRFEMSNLNEWFHDTAGTIGGRAIIDLVAGQYDIDMIQFEGGGAFFYELTAAPGEWLDATTPPGGFQLVGFTPPAATVIIPGIAEPGWTVETGTPNTAQYGANIAGAELRIDNTPVETRTSTWDVIDFTDPESGAEGSFTPTNPFPLNTPAPDDNYSIRATGILNVTVAGDYHLGFQGDDGGYMYIYGVGANPDPVINPTIVYTNHPAQAVIGPAPGSTVNNAIRVDVSTGNSRTIVSVPLNVGQYRIRTLFFDGVANSWWEVIGAKGPLDPSFKIPLLAKGPGTTVSLTSGLPLVEQSVVVVPGDISFNITGLSLTGDPVTSVSFNVGSEDGTTYTIQGSVDLVQWIDIETNLTATGNSTPFTANLAPFAELNGQPKLFFRAVQNP